MFSVGNEVWKKTESRVLPRNLRDVMGFTVFLQGKRETEIKEGGFEGGETLQWR